MNTHMIHFHNDTLTAFDKDGHLYVAVKPIVENLGLSWGSQQQKLAANKERWGIAIIDIPSSGGLQDTLCLPQSRLYAFLASVNAKKVLPHIRPKLIQYQRECDLALEQYWTGRLRPEPTEPPVLELHSGFSPRVNRELSRAWLSKPQNRKFVKYAHLPIARADMALMCGWKASSTVSLKRRVAETLGLIAPNPSLMPSSFQRHVALQRAASSNTAIANHGAHHG